MQHLPFGHEQHPFAPNPSAAERYIDRPESVPVVPVVPTTIIPAASEHRSDVPVSNADDIASGISQVPEPARTMPHIVEAVATSEPPDSSDDEAKLPTQKDSQPEQIPPRETRPDAERAIHTAGKAVVGREVAIEPPAERADSSTGAPAAAPTPQWDRAEELQPAQLDSDIAPEPQPETSTPAEGAAPKQPTHTVEARSTPENRPERALAPLTTDPHTYPDWTKAGAVIGEKITALGQPRTVIARMADYPMATLQNLITGKVRTNPELLEKVLGVLQIPPEEKAQLVALHATGQGIGHRQTELLKIANEFAAHGIDMFDKLPQDPVVSHEADRVLADPTIGEHEATRLTGLDTFEIKRVRRAIVRQLAGVLVEIAPTTPLQKIVVAGSPSKAPPAEIRPPRPVPQRHVSTPRSREPGGLVMTHMLRMISLRGDQAQSKLAAANLSEQEVKELLDPGAALPFKLLGKFAATLGMNARQTRIFVSGYQDALNPHGIVPRMGAMLELYRTAAEMVALGIDPDTELNSTFLGFYRLVTDPRLTVDNIGRLYGVQGNRALQPFTLATLRAVSEAIERRKRPKDQA